MNVTKQNVSNGEWRCNKCIYFTCTYFILVIFYVSLKDMKELQNCITYLT